MKKNIFYYIVGFVALSLPVAFTSCGDDDDYSAGPEVSSDCPNVYFSESNTYTVTLTDKEVKADPEAVRTVSINMERTDTKGEIKVPIVVDSKSDGVDIPADVTFADGAGKAELVISYTHPENGLEADFHVGDNYANPYAKKEGAVSYSLAIFTVVKVCDVTYDASSVFAGVTSEIYNFSGQNKFQWRNFLGSGLNVNFKVGSVKNEAGKDSLYFNPEALLGTYGSITFLDHTFDYYNNGSLYLMNDDDNYATWTPVGSSSEITYYYLYAGSTYSWVSFNPITEGSDAYSGYFYSGPQASYLKFYFSYNEE